MGIQKKKHGQDRDCLCAFGYSHVPGEDFMDISSPVVDDVTVRTVITNVLVQGWDSEVLDVTTAFLYGEMEEEVYMKCPVGIDLVESGWNLEEENTKLLRTIYGTKQAA
jgi:hypothetical protein